MTLLPAALVGSASLSSIGANGVLEGGLPGRRPGSWLVSARHTHNDLATDGELPDYGDAQARLSWEPGRGQQLSVFGLFSSERLDRREDDDSGENAAVRTLWSTARSLR